MARNATILVLRTTRADLVAQAALGNLIPGEPYLIVDEGRLAWAISTTEFRTGLIDSDLSGMSFFSQAVIDDNLPLIHFYDDFNRGNAPLDYEWGWTRQSGTIEALKMVGGMLGSWNTDGTGTVYQAPDIETADHFVQARIMNPWADTGPFLACRLASGTEYVGVRSGSQGLEIYQRAGGGLSSLGSGAAVAVGQILRLECQGTTARVLVSGSQVWSGTISSYHTSTRAGLVSRAVAVPYWIDDFECGPLT